MAMGQGEQGTERIFRFIGRDQPRDTGIFNAGAEGLSGGDRVGKRGRFRRV
jgi:hypothetical protein